MTRRIEVVKRPPASAEDTGTQPPNEIRVRLPGAVDALRFTETVRLGRGESNGIVLDNEVVSLEHLELLRTEDGWEIVDLGSTNGTYVSNRLVTRSPLGAHTSARLGPGGPVVDITIPALADSGGTREMPSPAYLDRYFGEETPSDMSTHTAIMRAAFRTRLGHDALRWVRRNRHLKVAMGVLAALALGAGSLAIWQASRVRALREVAGTVFNTMKSLDLDLRRLQAVAGPNPSLEEQRARLESQYEDMLRTLGIYSRRTPADEQLIYRVVHRLGESEATVPRGFVNEVRKYIGRWKTEDINASIARAQAQNLAPRVSSILLQHHLPPEFFYLALQESKLDTRAIGPSTRLGVPKGLWQLIPSTAEAYGLRLGPLQGERAYDPSDERHDPSKATAAAARYLNDIYNTDAQASGLLVAASYNMGETRMRRLIRSLPESPAQRNFWALLRKHRQEIPKETYDYVFRVVSAAVIGANPRLFGFDFDPLFEVTSDAIGGASTE